MNNIKKLCEEIWRFEKENDLLDLEIQGVKVWQYIRMPIYYDIAENIGVLQKPHVLKQTLYGRVKKLYSSLKSILFYNPIFVLGRHVDEVVIDHPRHKCVDGNHIDIYSYYYLNDLKQAKRDYLVLERPSLAGLHIKTDTQHRKYLDSVFAFSKLRQMLIPVRLTGEESVQLKDLESKLYNTFAVEIDLVNKFRVAIAKFKSNYSMYRRIFSRLHPDRLVVIVSYAYGDAIKAAKDLDIETVEIQHGTFSEFHLGYSFPNRVDRLDYFPDIFMAWGEYWKDLHVIPLSEDNVVISGFSHFNYLRGRYKDIVKADNKIVVLSQGALGNQIADKILEQIDSLAYHSIVYKLHPGEYSRWMEYESLVKLSKFPNVKVVKDEDIYKLLAESIYQIGVFSTALYEGIGFNCKTILLDLPGIEYMEDLLKCDAVKVLREHECITSVMNDFSQDTVNYENISARVFAN